MLRKKSLCSNTYTYAHTHTHTHTCVCACMQARTHACTPLHARIHKHTYTHILTYKNTCITLGGNICACSFFLSDRSKHEWTYYANFVAVDNKTSISSIIYQQICIRKFVQLYWYANIVLHSHTHTYIYIYVYVYIYIWCLCVDTCVNTSIFSAHISAHICIYLFQPTYVC